MQIYLVITSDARKANEWGAIESYICNDKTSAQIKLNELYKYARSLANEKTDEIYFDGDGFDVFFEAGGVYYGTIEKKEI